MLTSSMIISYAMNVDMFLEFCDPRIGEIQNLIGKIHGMNIDSHSLHFYGTCKDIEACEHRKAKTGKKDLVK